jgi:hypothetical protein
MAALLGCAAGAGGCCAGMAGAPVSALGVTFCST